MLSPVAAPFAVIASVAFTLSAVAQEQQTEPSSQEAGQAGNEAARYEAIEEEQAARARAYVALVHETDLYQQFRSYLAPGYQGLKESRGMVTDKLKLTARLRDEISYDNNLFLDSSGEIADVINTVNPAVRAAYQADPLLIELGYEAWQRTYVDHSELNGLEQLADGLIRYSARDFTVEAWDKYVDSREPLDVVLLRERFRRQINDTGASLDVAFNKLALTLRGAHRDYDNVTGSLQQFDHEAWSADLQIGTEIVVRTSVLAEVGWTATYYDLDVLDDYETWRFLLGVQGRPLDKLSFSVKAGWVTIDVDETSGSVERSDDSGVTLRAGAVWRLSVPTLLTVGVRHEPVESSGTGGALRTLAEAGWKQWLGERLWAGLSTYWERVTEQGSPSRWGYGVRVTGRYEMGRNFFLDISAEVRGAGSSDPGTRYDDLRGYLAVGAEF